MNFWEHSVVKWETHPGIQTAIVFIAILTVFILGGLLLLPVLVPVLLSFVLYAVLGPINNRLVRSGLGRNRSASVLLLAVFILFGLPLLLLAPVVTEAVGNSSGTLDAAKTSLQQILEASNSKLSSLGISFDPQQVMNAFNTASTRFDQDTLISASNYLLSFTATLILVPFMTFFLIRDFSRIRNRIMAWLPNRYFELGWSIYFKVAKQLQMYVRGAILQQGILTVVTSVGFWIAGYPLPIVLGITAGILGIIPYLGPILGLLLPLIIALSMDPFSLWFLISAIIVIGVANTIDNLFVVPIVIAGAVNLHPMLVIVGVIIFGNAMGIIGLIIAIPLMAVVKILYGELYNGLHSIRAVRKVG